MQNRVVRLYEIGGIILKYIGPDFQEKDYLSIFRTIDCIPDITYELFPVCNIEKPESNCIIKENYIDTYDDCGIRTRIIYDQDKSQILMKDMHKSKDYHRVEYAVDSMQFWFSSMMMKLFDLPKQILSYQGVFLHASYVKWKEKALIFTAPKQTGKSTQAALWEEYNHAEVINGDRVLIRKIDGIWMACGSPYSGSSKISKNLKTPIGAIVILSQAEENHLRQANKLESLIALMEGCSYSAFEEESVIIMSEVANEILQDVPFYKLACLPDKTAVDILEESLW